MDEKNQKSNSTIDWVLIDSTNEFSKYNENIKYEMRKDIYGKSTTTELVISDSELILHLLLNRFGKN